MVMDMGRDPVTHDEVELAYRPTRGDLRAGVGVRERVRHLHLLRWALTAVFLALAAQSAVSTKGSALSFVLAVFCAAVIWAMPHAQAHHALRTVSWQGEYRATVTDDGIRTETRYVTLEQRWSVFRGHRETRDHFVLLSRDPNILLVEVLPKRGLRAEADADRLRALLARRLPVV
ncbi:YcxB family protein [Streptomyces chromofuscus]|uniref:YcxB family protein n=1 Tax=Streptomyces chromofuscus TaxID=42881 RepID=A0A7M2TCW1_STRCW|nr:YcxB family protein [Streptomyces chromofuscus]QOV46566.1 YcxB family protein [Streptomyces chromofuscus]GGT07792.1 hypothetical protein GCM10010254_30230 [Streptomyces chromofuscus]